MMRKDFLAGLALLAAGTAPAAAQDAEPTLYTRSADGVVRVAIEIDIDPDSHLYHGPTKADLGHPQAVGSPTIVTLTGLEVAEWSPVRFPEPHVFDQSEFGAGVFINGHEDIIVLYAAAALPEGASADIVGADLKGLICDDFGCLPWKKTVTSQGEGPDSVWEDFPADLVPGSGAAEPAGAAPRAAFVAEEDEHVSGEADATLYTRIDDADPTKLRAALEIEITDGWHLYHVETGNPKAIGKPTTITLGGEGITWSEPRWPEPETFDQSDVEEGAWIWGHEGTVIVYAEGDLAAGADGYDAFAELDGQTCEDMCIGYRETAFTQGPGPQAAWVGWTAGEEAGAGDEGDDDERPLGPFLLEAMLWGLITLLMPCTYPMIPITISFFTKQADARGGNVVPLSLAYGFGIVLIFILIGAAIGPAIVPFAQGFWLNLVIAILFFYFALVLLGFVNLQPPRFLLNAAGKASTKGGFAGVFLMGACLVVTSFTCTAPFVGTLLARGAVSGDLTRVVAGMAVFGLTMAIPFVFLSLVPGKVQALPKSGMWMNTLKVTLGFVEIAAAFKFLSNADLAKGWGILSRELFLILWIVIFVVTALYLYGVVRIKGMKEEVGVKRMTVATAFLAFAGYCGWGLFGNQMDFVMSAMLPNYSGGRFTPQLYEFGGDWVIVEDDLEEAVELAREEGKLVFVNFTGHT